MAVGRNGDECAVLQARHLPDLLDEMSVLDVVLPYVECPSDHRAAEASESAPEAVLPVLITLKLRRKRDCMQISGLPGEQEDWTLSLRNTTENAETHSWLAA